jgi:hypothetical protein
MRRRSSRRSRKSGGRRPRKLSAKRKYPTTIKSDAKTTSEGLYKKGDTGQLGDHMTLETLRAIAWRNGIAFGGLNKTELLRKLRNSLT